MDDAFDRLLAREAEIRRRIDDGDITDEEADALRELIDEEAVEDGPRADREGLRVSVEQVARIVDEGVEPEALRALLDLAPRLSVDDAIDLAAEYAPETDDLRRLRQVAAPALDADQLRGLFDYAVEPEAVEAAARYGCADPVDVAIRLTEYGACVETLLADLSASGITDLTADELIAVAENDIDPDAIRRMRDAGIEFDATALTARRSVTLGVNLNLGSRHLLLGTGRERIRRSGTVSGFYVGDVTVDPGLTVDFAATLIGTLHIGAAADVTITGRVTGSVDRDEAAPSGAASSA